MKLEIVQQAEEIRHSMIREIKVALEDIFKRYGSHEYLATEDLARMLTDEIDFDVIARLLK